jgi:hypothetical protein
MARDLTQAELVRLLALWLGASGPAFLVALWGVWEAWRDLRAAHRLHPPRLALVGQARANLALAGSFLLEGSLYLCLGLLIVAGSAHITLTGPLALIVLVPPGTLIFQVLTLRVNRVLQERLR